MAAHQKKSPIGVGIVLFIYKGLLVILYGCGCGRGCIMFNEYGAGVCGTKVAML